MTSAHHLEAPKSRLIQDKTGVSCDTVQLWSEEGIWSEYDPLLHLLISVPSEDQVEVPLVTTRHEWPATSTKASKAQKSPAVGSVEPKESQGTDRPAPGGPMAPMKILGENRNAAGGSEGSETQANVTWLVEGSYVRSTQ